MIVAMRFFFQLLLPFHESIPYGESYEYDFMYLFWVDILLNKSLTTYYALCIKIDYLLKFGIHTCTCTIRVNIHFIENLPIHAFMRVHNLICLIRFNIKSTYDFSSSRLQTIKNAYNIIKRI